MQWTNKLLLNSKKITEFTTPVNVVVVLGLVLHTLPVLHGCCLIVDELCIACSKVPYPTVSAYGVFFSSLKGLDSKDLGATPTRQLKNRAVVLPGVLLKEKVFYSSLAVCPSQRTQQP